MTTIDNVAPMSENEEMEKEFPFIDKKSPGKYVMVFIEDMHDIMLGNLEYLHSNTIIEVVITLRNIRKIYFSKKFEEFKKHVLDGTFLKSEKDKETVKTIRTYMDHVEDIIAEDCVTAKEAERNNAH